MRGVELLELHEEGRHLVRRARVRLLVGVGLVLGEVEALDALRREGEQREPPLARLHDHLEIGEQAVDRGGRVVPRRDQHGHLLLPRLDVRAVDLVHVEVPEAADEHARLSTVRSLDEVLERAAPLLAALRALDVPHLHLVLETAARRIRRSAASESALSRLLRVRVPARRSTT